MIPTCFEYLLASATFSQHFIYGEFNKILILISSYLNSRYTSGWTTITTADGFLQSLENICSELR